VKLIDQVILASDQPGIISYIEPEEGDEVRAGQTVARLRDEVAAAVYARVAKEAENDVEIRYARKAADVAKAELEASVEANRLVPTAVPPIELDRLRLTHERSVLQIEQAENQQVINGLLRDEKDAELKRYKIEAPFDGVVTLVFKSEGEALRQGDPILELKNTKRVRVEGQVEIQDVWRVRPGARVEVRLDIPKLDLDIEKETFAGRISFVDVTVQPVGRTTRIWAEVANHKNLLRAGLTTTMTIFPNELVEETADRRGPGHDDAK
jgi:macrolide-specific efflux system membrane fusion protein